jgi:predicted dehydrogenase
VPLALRALAAGRSVLVEKPPVLSLTDLDGVLAAAKARGLTAGVMLQHRFRLPPQATAGPWDAATVASVEVVRYRPQAHYAKAGWRVEPREAGGGLIAHLGVHYLDLACRLLGVPAEITADVDVLPGSGIDQRVVLSARFESGARLSFIGTTAVDQRLERLAVYDSGRSIVVDNRGTTCVADTNITRPAPSTASLRAEVYADVARAVREGRPPAVADLASARGVVRLIEAVIAATPAGSEG